MSASLLRKLRHRATELSISRAVIVSVRHRGIRETDAFLASYPKSGNTWLKFMLAEALAQEVVDFDTVEDVVSEVGRHGDRPQLLPNGGRLIKTHEPYRHSLARHYRHAIYIVRDGRDVAVSYYFSMIRSGLFDGPFSIFLNRFLSGRVGGFGSWHAHVDSWLKAKSNVLILRYEDMLVEPVSNLRRATDFLGIARPNHELEAIVQSNDADNMRSRERGTRMDRNRVRQDINFVRSASSGNWREHFSAAELDQFIEVAGNTLSTTGYTLE